MRCIAELTVMAVDNRNDNYVLLLHHSFLDNIMHILLTINITNAEANSSMQMMQFATVAPTMPVLHSSSNYYNYIIVI